MMNDFDVQNQIIQQQNIDIANRQMHQDQLMAQQYLFRDTEIGDRTDLKVRNRIYDKVDNKRIDIRTLSMPYTCFDESPYDAETEKSKLKILLFIVGAVILLIMLLIGICFICK